MNVCFLLSELRSLERGPPRLLVLRQCGVSYMLFSGKRALLAGVETQQQQHLEQKSLVLLPPSLFLRPLFLATQWAGEKDPKMAGK